MPAQRPRAVLFDLDDTLFDHRGCAGEALRALVPRYAGLARWTPEALDRAHLELIDELHARVLRGELPIDAARLERFGRLLAKSGEDPGAAAAAAAEYRRVYLAARRPLPGAPELLTRLREYARIVIVSNNLADEQRGKLVACGLTLLVDALVVSEEVGATKPDRAIFDAALAARSEE